MQGSAFKPGYFIGAIGVVILGIAALAWAPWSAQARAEDVAPRASTVAMNCAPGQQALVRQSVAGRELNVSIECAGDPLAAPATYRNGFDGALVAPGQPAGIVPAVYRPAPAPVQVYSAPAPRAQRSTTVRRVEPRRDWKREALIIGGSAGTGAGIGGLIGGKKGALIGAAIGGGGSALWRASK